jgi:hypothetical protein
MRPVAPFSTENSPIEINIKRRENHIVKNIWLT